MGPGILIFIPSFLYNEESGRLYGRVDKCLEKNVIAFFIVSVHKAQKSIHTSDFFHDLGEYSKHCQYMNKSHYHTSENWLLLGMKCNEFSLQSVVTKRGNINLYSAQKIILVVYDYNLFLQADLLLTSSEGITLQEYGNFLYTLTHTIKRNHEQTVDSQRFAFLHNIMNVMTKLVDTILHITLHLLPVLKYSSLGLRVYHSLKGLSWALKCVTSRRKLHLKIGNYIVATLVDVCFGLFILFWLMTFVSSSSQLLLNAAEVVVNTLQELVKWLMGIPAGLKLNFAFNNMLGRFFLYHINLWWTFLVIAKPLLDFIFHVFLCFGWFGVTFQAAILADLLALASFHVYCIYVYAARLYNLQISGLISLWRLFLGRKHNPLRNRVDSCHYSANQLFIGTLAFTILLFLLPTTFMYYIVFTTLRVLVAALGGLLTRVQMLMQTLPLYVTVLWTFHSASVSSSMHLQVKGRLPGEPLVLSASPVPSSWWATVQYCIPENIPQLPEIKWKTLCKYVATGQLIYPL